MGWSGGHSPEISRVGRKVNDQKNTLKVVTLFNRCRFNEKLFDIMSTCNLSDAEGFFHELVNEILSNKIRYIIGT